MKIVLIALALIGVTYILKGLVRSRFIHGSTEHSGTARSMKKISEFMSRFEASEIGKYRTALIEMPAREFAYALKSLPKDQREQLKKWSEEILVGYNLLLERYNTFVIDVKALPWTIADLVLAFKIAYLYYYLQDMSTGSLKRSFLKIARFTEIRPSEIRHLFKADTPLTAGKISDLVNEDMESFTEAFPGVDPEALCVLYAFVERIRKHSSILVREIEQYEEELIEVLKQAVLEKNR